jgi:hypothetical protein
MKPVHTLTPYFMHFNNIFHLRLHHWSGPFPPHFQTNLYIKLQVFTAKWCVCHSAFSDDGDRETLVLWTEAAHPLTGLYQNFICMSHLFLAN